jgi:acetoin utilization deacetylase AcuC-like enzyme
LHGYCQTLRIMKSPKLHTFYNPKMSLDPEKLTGYTQNPAKPKLLMEFLERKGLLEYFQVDGNFSPFGKEDFYIAHTREMVDNFFDKGKTSKILHIEWSPEYAESVRYENASLYQAIRYAVQHPEEVCFSPSGAFHHANPTRGALFCAFSGQVIASMKIYYEFGLCGVYIDLDGHFGNSIDNSRDYVADIDKAISPVCGNINIMAYHRKYIEELKTNLEILREEIISGRVNYVVFGHGADSHEWDELASQVSTEEWVECSRLVYSMIKETEITIGKQLPLILILFGGYRKDDFNSVLSLHTIDLVTCLNILCGRGINYVPEITPRKIKEG